MNCKGSSPARVRLEGKENDVTIVYNSLKSNKLFSEKI